MLCVFRLCLVAMVSVTTLNLFAQSDHAQVNPQMAAGTTSADQPSPDLVQAAAPPQPIIVALN
jgi:hypothetical protein